MKILLLTPQLPYPPHQGASLRNFNTLQYLASRHEVTLLTFLGADQSPLTLEDSPLNSLCREVHVVPFPMRSMSRRLRLLLSSRTPDMGDRLRSTAFDLKLAELLAAGSFDVVQVEGIELARAIPQIRRNSPASRILFDDHNAETDLQYRTFLTDLRAPRRWPAAAYSFVQVQRLKRFEATTCRMADWVTVVSTRDGELLQELAPELKAHVIPNSIDVALYANRQPEIGLHFDVVLTGKMDYRPNVDAALWFGKEVWPRILEARPQATWAIVGQQPDARLGRLQDLAGVTITGKVPDIQPYLAGAGVVIMPFRFGSGTRLKFIEALAAGRPVVSTTIGAEGYPAQHERQLLIADAPDDFATGVLRLLVDDRLAASLATEGLKLAEQYDWRRIGPLFDEVYASPPASEPS